MRHIHSVLRDMNEPPKTVRQGDFMNRVRFQDKSIRIALALFGAVIALAGVTPAQAQNFNVLYNFQGADAKDGAYPNGLVVGPNGYLYGTTGAGGQVDEGTVFRISPGGDKYEIMWAFASHINAIDGDGTSAALVLATNGAFYGTTLGNSGGGSGNGSDGVVFRITPGGALTPLYNFCTVENNGQCLDGLTTLAPMMQARNGDLYGTTSRAGAGNQGTRHRVAR
jgi:uncharacterized repeat protein (TIGR03803 family)